MFMGNAKQKPMNDPEVMIAQICAMLKIDDGFGTAGKLRKVRNAVFKKVVCGSLEFNPYELEKRCGWLEEIFSQDSEAYRKFIEWRNGYNGPKNF